MSKNILLAEIMHETNTFNRIPTTRQDFDARYWLEGDEVGRGLKNTNTEICGFLDAAGDRGWQVTTPLAASASPSGQMAERDWARVMGLILAPLNTEKFDAVFLVLHGSMVTETTLDAEGELLSLVRKTVSDDTLIAVSLDMHANVSNAMIENADIMMAYRTYPHVDQYERAQHIARLMDDVFSRNKKPKLYHARIPMMDAANHGQTAEGQPMNAHLNRAAELEQSPEILCASIQIGFPWSDVPDIGPSVIITGFDDGTCEIAAKSLMEGLWENRHETQLEFATPEAAIQKAADGIAGSRPLVLADFADNPAGGAYGDSPQSFKGNAGGGAGECWLCNDC